MATLVEYARSRSCGNQCPVCALPDDLLQEVEDGFSAGLKATVIRSWLVEEKQIDVPYDIFYNHRRYRHAARRR